MHPALEWTLTLCAAAGCLGWIVFLLRATRGILSLQELEEQPASGEKNDLPSLSIVIAARNEATSLEKSLRSWLDASYPDLEILVVNDRSTDATGEIADRLAESSSQLEVIHIDELPPGWLGKVHALREGARRARGTWLLFTDADVHVSKHLLQRAIHQAVGEPLDHLALLPEVRTGGFWAQCTLAAFAALFVERTRIARLGPEPGDGFVGVGAFNLVRRERLESSEGFEWIRLEIADDVGLGLVLQRAGARSALRTALNDLHVLWYSGLGEMIRGLQKNLFPSGCQLSYWRLLAVISGSTLLMTGPPLALLSGLPGPLRLFPVLAALCLALFAASYRSRLSRPFLEGFALPVGFGLLLFAMVRSAFFCWKNGGISWRETHYSLETLRSGQRVRL